MDTCRASRASRQRRVHIAPRRARLRLIPRAVLW
jgi:hypothetical protein